jgi:hypothetical protein
MAISDYLVGHWLLDDDMPNTTVAESSGNNYFGILTDPAGTATTAFHHLGGTKGSCLDFDGTDDNIQIQDTDDGQFNLTDITVTMWAKVTVSARVDEYVFVTYYTSNGPYILRYDPANNQIDWILGNNTNVVVKSENVTIEGAWHLITATYDSVAEEMHIYIDDAEVGTATANTYGIGSATPSLIIGGKSAGDYLDGLICDVRIYSIALSLTEVQSIYNETKTEVEIISTNANLLTMLGSPSSKIYELTADGGTGSDGIYILDTNYAISQADFSLRPTDPSGSGNRVEINGNSGTDYEFKLNGVSDGFIIGRADSLVNLVFNHCRTIVTDSSADITGSFYNCDFEEGDDTGLSIVSASIYDIVVNVYGCHAEGNINDGYSVEGSRSGLATGNLYRCSATGHSGSSSDGATNHEHHILNIYGGDYYGNVDGVHSVDDSITTINNYAHIHGNIYGVHFGSPTDTASQTTTLSSNVTVDDNSAVDLLGEGSAVLKIGDSVIVDQNRKVLEGTSLIIDFYENKTYYQIAGLKSGGKQ